MSPLPCEIKGLKVQRAKPVFIWWHFAIGYACFTDLGAFIVSSSEATLMIHFQMHTSQYCNMTQSDILSGTQRISHLAVQLAIENGTNVDTSIFVLHTFHRQFDIRAAGSGPLKPPENAPPRESPVGAFGHL